MEATKKRIKGADAMVHLRSRGMWNDGKQPKQITDILYKDGKWAYHTFYMSPALVKAFDELISNMVDQYITSKRKGFVISSIFDRENKSIIFKNTGGFPIHDMVESPGTWSVEAAFINMMTSSNFDSKERDTGGLNGIGLTFCVAVSETTHVTTSDGKQVYEQTFTGRKKSTEQAKASVKKLSRVPSTTITFLPDYKLFELEEDNNITDEILDTINTIIETRMRFASLYTGITVKYNTLSIKETFDTLVNGLSGDKPFKTTVKSSNPKYDDWTVGFCICEGGGRVISIVNGIYSKGGDHINLLFRQITNHVKEKASKLKAYKNKSITPSIIKDKIVMVMVGKIPDVDFNAQNKADAVVDKNILKCYDLNTAVKNKIWNFIRPHLEEQNVVSDLKLMNKKTKLKLGNDYVEAPKSRSKQKLDCLLFLPEGLSAASPVRTGMKTHPKKDYMGYLVMGVIPNIRKHITGKSKFSFDTVVLNNKKLNNFRQVMNLTIGKEYKTENELKDLRYGTVVIATDQDIDGIGNICPLILNYIYYCWPELVKQGRVKRLSTPLVIATHKRSKKAKTFYLEHHFLHWVSTVDENHYNIMYFKGLGTNEKKMPEIFKNLEENLYTFSVDDVAEKSFIDYYGKDADIRKAILKTPLKYPSYDDYPSHGMVSCSDFLKLEAKSYFQEEKLFRNPIHAIDGMMISRRKVFAAARKSLANSSKPTKVMILIGKIIAEWGYHHGPASLEGSIVCLTDIYPGSALLPLLLSGSSIAGRITGRAEAAKPRYMDVYYNKVADILFPREDDALLPKSYVDGVKCEPLHYVPILPYALMQYYSVPVTGWKQELVARSLDDIKNAILSKLNGRLIRRLKPCEQSFTGTTTETGSKVSFIGSYKVMKQSSKFIGYTITELPPGVLSGKVKEKLDLLDEVTNVDDKTSKYGKVEIDVFTTQEFDTTEKSKVELQKFLCIKKISTAHLNFPNDETMLEFKNYKAVFNNWFPEREALYFRRFKRQSIIIKLKIKMLENMVRYVNEFMKLNVVKKKTDIVYQILEKNNFDKMNVTPLTTINDIHEDTIESIVLGPEASYSYLDLRDSQKFKETNTKRENELARLRKEYDRLTEDPKKLVKETWIEEVEKLYTSINKGFANQWGHKYDK